MPCNCFRVVKSPLMSPERMDILLSQQGSSPVGAKLAAGSFNMYTNLQNESGMSRSFEFDDPMTSSADLVCVNSQSIGNEGDDSLALYPQCYDQLPPLEQKRQLAIHDTLKDLESLLKGYNNDLTDLKLLSRDNEDNTTSGGYLELFTSKANEVFMILETIIGNIPRLQIKYEEKSSRRPSITAFIETVGSLLCAKMSVIISCYKDMTLMAMFLPEKQSIKQILQAPLPRDLHDVTEDLIVTLEEGISDLLENTSKVLTSTPRKHPDFKPLRSITEELKSVVKEIEANKYEEKCQKTNQTLASFLLHSTPSKSEGTLKRRISWDNLSIRNIFQVGRSPQSLISVPPAFKNKTKSEERTRLNSSLSPTGGHQMFTRRLASTGTPTYQASTLPLPKSKNKDGGHVASKSQRKSLNAEIIYSTPTRGFSEEFTEVLSVSPKSRHNSTELQNNNKNDFQTDWSHNCQELPSNRPEQSSNQSDSYFFHNSWQEHSRLAPRILEDEVFVVAECVDEVECEQSNSERLSFEHSNSSSGATSRQSSVSHDQSLQISFDQNMTSAQSHPSILNLLPDVDCDPSSRSSSCSSDYMFPKRSRNSTLPVSSTHANSSEIIISGIGSRETRSLDNCHRSGSKTTLNKTVSDSDTGVQNSHSSCQRTLSFDCYNQRKRSSDSRASSNSSRGNSPNNNGCQQTTSVRRVSQIKVAENLSQPAAESNLQSSHDSKLNSSADTSQDSSRIDSSVNTSPHSKENDSRIANHTQNGGLKSTPNRVVFLEKKERPNKLDLSPETPPPAKWWTAAKTPELKPRLNTTQEARRHTLSAIEQPNVEQRRMLLKKSKNIGEGARRWQEAFEVLLADTRGIEVFRVFLRSEFSEENMVFFLACEELKRTRSFRVGPRARRIFKTFIEDNSPQEVNLDYETKKHIMESMRTPNRNIFDAAQRKVREMMAADAYPRFIRSDFYKSLIT